MNPVTGIVLSSKMISGFNGAGAGREGVSVWIIWVVVLGTSFDLSELMFKKPNTSSLRTLPFLPVAFIVLKSTYK